MGHFIGPDRGELSTVETSHITQNPVNERNGLFSEVTVFCTRHSLGGDVCSWPVNHDRHERVKDGPDLIRESEADSDRNFWTGQRRLSLMQWVGVILMFVAAAVIATSLGLRVFALVLGALIAFVVLGHFLAHRKRRSVQ